MRAIKGRGDNLVEKHVRKVRKCRSDGGDEALGEGSRMCLHLAFIMHGR